jgi:hypothetical protein
MGGNKLLIAIVIVLFMPFALFAQWQTDVRLTDDPSESVTCFSNAWGVASYGSTVHVVWHDDRDGNTEIYYTRSTDSGTNWETDVRITDDVSWSERPSIAVSDSIVHVAWYDGRLGPPRIFYTRSLDNGTTWGSDISLTPTAGVAYHPSIAVSDSIVHVVWTDMSAGPQIYYARSLDNGATWDPDTIITSGSPPAGKNLASVAVSDSIVHVVWMDMRADPQIYYTRSLDNGTTWEVDRGISPDSAQFPSVAVHDSVVHLVYADFRLGPAFPKIYYQHSLDNGTTWETEVMLADSFASWYPSVAVSDSKIHAVWLDSRHGDPSEVYYRRSMDNGITWDAEVRLTDNLSESKEVSVGVSDSIVHVVWHDDRDGNWEIYYKRNPTGNAGIEEKEKDLSSNLHTLFVPSFFNDRITLKFNQSEEGALRVALYDIRGVPVFSATYDFVPSLLSLRDERIQHLSPGVYFLSVDVNRRTETQKLIKLR